jgi:hypothetical protein
MGLCSDTDVSASRVPNSSGSVEFCIRIFFLRQSTKSRPATARPPITLPTMAPIGDFVVANEVKNADEVEDVDEDVDEGCPAVVDVDDKISGGPSEQLQPLIAVLG